MPLSEQETPPVAQPQSLIFSLKFLPHCFVKSKSAIPEKNSCRHVHGLIFIIVTAYLLCLEQGQQPAGTQSSTVMQEATASTNEATNMSGDEQKNMRKRPCGKCESCQRTNCGECKHCK